MGRGTLWEVQDRSGDLWGGLGQVGGPLGRSEIGWGTRLEVLEGPEDPRGLPGWSWDPRKGPGRIG